jgi:hypothetical protein
MCRSASSSSSAARQCGTLLAASLFNIGRAAGQGALMAELLHALVAMDLPGPPRDHAAGTALGVRNVAVMVTKKSHASMARV